MKDILLITFAHLFFAVAVCHGQEQNIVPVTPEAAALSKMVNYPVAMYTGIPDISIPLYEIKSGEIVLPITLQYHAGGFKVNEKHTREGLGWSLGCDLQVTRTINGSDDFGPNGYARSTLVTSSPFVFYSKQELFPSARNYRMAVGEIDGQPDKFSYRLLGKSGSFFILKDGTGTSYSFVPVPSENIKVEMAGNSFVITDSDGTVYYFEGQETTNTGQNDIVTCWKCTRVVDNLGTSAISFEYASKAEVATKSSTDLIDYYSAHSYNSWNFNSYGGYFRSDQPPLSGYAEYNPYGAASPFCRVSNPKYIQYFANDKIKPVLHVPYYNASTGKLVDATMDFKDPESTKHNVTTSKIKGLALSRIKFRGGEAVFTGTGELTKIQVSDAKNQIVKTISFYHSYAVPYDMADARKYNGYAFNGTMYLDSIKLGAGSNMYETYAFLYNNKYCFGDHLVGNDAWGFPNETTYEKAFSSMTSMPSKSFKETYYLDISGFPNSTKLNLSYTTSGSNWSLASDDYSMNRGVLKRIVYPTGGFVDFDFEANSYKQNFPVYIVPFDTQPNELPQLCGGLRVRSISFFEKGGTKPVSQKYYTYGEYEEGTGEMANRPKFNLTGTIRNMDAVDVVRYVANWSSDCNNYYPCNTRSSLNLMSIEKKTSLYSASMLDYTYANGTSAYYTKVTEYSIDMGISSGKKVYTFYPPQYFHASFNEHSRIPETLVPYIKTSLFLGAQKSISEFEFVSPEEWKLKNRKTFEYEKQMKSEVVQASYSTFRILHEVRAGTWYPPKTILYNDDYTLNGINTSEFGGEYIYGNYGIPIGKLLLRKETEEHVENGRSTVTTTEYTYKRLQPSEIKTTNSNGERYTKHLTYPFDLDGVYDQMEAKNMLGLVIQERIVNTGTGAEVMRKKTNYALKADIGGILPSSVEISYGGGNAEIETTYDKYDQYGNILQLTGKDQTPVSYLWGYQGLYPVAQLRGVQYAQIPVTYTVSTTINDPASDTALRTLLIELKNSFYGKEQVSGYTYKRLTGMTSHFDEKGAVTYYEYDPYGRLTTVKDHNQHPVGSYTYKTDNSPKVSLTPFWVNTPVMATVQDGTQPAGRSYNAIMPGGEVSGYSTESSNLTARNRLASGQGIRLYPDADDTAPTASLQLVGYYYPLICPYFPTKIDIDLLKDGHVVYTTSIPVNNAVLNSSSWERKTLCLPAGNYQISIKPSKSTYYEENGIVVQFLREIPSDGTNLIMNLGTITLEGGKTYVLSVSYPS